MGPRTGDATAVAVGGVLVIWLVAYWAFGALTALTVFAIEETPRYQKMGGGLTDRPVGVLAVICLWPILLIVTTIAMLRPVKDQIR